MTVGYEDQGPGGFSRDVRPIPDPTKLTTDAVSAATSIIRREMLSQRELLETRLEAMDKATELLAATVGKVPSETDKAISAMKELIDTRLKAMDQANELLANSMTRDLTALKEILTGEVEKTAAISVERYESVKIIFDDHALALDAALAAQKQSAELRMKSVNDSAVALLEILRAEIRNVEAVSNQKFEAVEGTFSSNALALTAALAAQKEAAAEQNKSNTLAISKSETATKETIAANAATTANGQASQAATIADLKDRLVRLEAGGVAPGNAHGEQRADTTLAEALAANRATQAKSQITLVIAGASVVIALITLVTILFLHK